MAKALQATTSNDTNFINAYRELGDEWNRAEDGTPLTDLQVLHILVSHVGGRMMALYRKGRQIRAERLNVAPDIISNILSWDVVDVP